MNTRYYGPLLRCAKLQRQDFGLQRLRWSKASRHRMPPWESKNWTLHIGLGTLHIGLGARALWPLGPSQGPVLGSWPRRHLFHEWSCKHFVVVTHASVTPHCHTWLLNETFSVDLTLSNIWLFLQINFIGNYCEYSKNMLHSALESAPKEDTRLWARCRG